MILWAVLFGLLATHTWAEVVQDFNTCSGFFYKKTPPSGFDQNAAKICQCKTEYKEYLYFTLYSKEHKIPLYSAYRVDPGCNEGDKGKSGNWFIEPQLLRKKNPIHMDTESKYTKIEIKTSQAINADYERTGYDRGHLNPNSFQCGEDREATFTLTNGAPMDACFNRVQWKTCETAVKQALTNKDKSGTAYLVTGTVLPDQDTRIPKKGEFDDPGERDYNRVTVPSHVWTAVCYRHPDDEEESFSFGLMGENKPDGKITILTIAELREELSKKYNNLNIFENDCSFSNPEFHEILLTLYKNINPNLKNQLVMSPGISTILTPVLIHSFKNRRISKDQG